jgi:hypothetical protein
MADDPAELKKAAPISERNSDWLIPGAAVRREAGKMNT